jgi:hypothetical protein
MVAESLFHIRAVMYDAVKAWVADQNVVFIGLLRQAGKDILALADYVEQREKNTTKE